MAIVSDDDNGTLFEVNVTSMETCFTLNENLISREANKTYILVMPFDYFDNTSEYHVGFPFILKLIVTGSKINTLLIYLFNVCAHLVPPPPCPCEQRLALIACKVLEMNGEELPLPCIKAL